MMRPQSKTHNRQEEQVASVLLLPGFVSTCSRPLHLGQRGGRDAGSNTGTRLAMITRTHEGPAAQPGWPSERAALGAIVGLSVSPCPTATGRQGTGRGRKRNENQDGTGTHGRGEGEKTETARDPGTDRSSKGDRVGRHAQCQGQKTAKPVQQTGGQTWGGDKKGWGGWR